MKDFSHADAGVYHGDMFQESTPSPAVLAAVEQYLANHDHTLITAEVGVEGSFQGGDD